MQITDRTSAYLYILHWGILTIRNVGSAALPDYPEIEADHLHNLPDYLQARATEHSHRYYLDVERDLYVQKLRDRGFDSNESIAFCVGQYQHAWRVLETEVGRAP